MAFSRRDFVQSSLAAAIPGAAIRKTWMDRVASTSLRRLELPFPDSPILLDHNENAYGPSERVRAVLAGTRALPGPSPYSSVRGRRASERIPASFSTFFLNEYGHAALTTSSCMFSLSWLAI
jgi:hypothetical protein